MQSVFGQAVQHKNPFSFWDKKYIRFLVGLTTLVSMWINVATQVTALGRVFSLLTGFGYKEMAVIGMLVVVIYTMIGGMRATVITNIVQGILLTIACIAVPFSLVSYAGGMSGIESAVVANDGVEFADKFFSYMGGPTATGIIILMWWVNKGFTRWGSIKTFQAINSAKSVRAGVLGLALGQLGSVILCLFLLAPGIVFRAISGPGQAAADAENSYFMLTLKVFLGQPLVAAFLVIAVFGAIMSTASTHLISVGMSGVKDVYLKFINPNASADFQTKLGMWLTGLFGVISLILALFIPSVLKLFVLAGVVVVPITVPIMIAMFASKRASWFSPNTIGASLIVSFIIGFVFEAKVPVISAIPKIAGVPWRGYPSSIFLDVGLLFYL
ncbi:MAG: sodium:solute symporter family protein [Desulfitobacteriia bacterium]